MSCVIAQVQWFRGTVPLSASIQLAFVAKVPLLQLLFARILLRKPPTCPRIPETLIFLSAGLGVTHDPQARGPSDHARYATGFWVDTAAPTQPRPHPRAFMATPVLLSQPVSFGALCKGEGVSESYSILHSKTVAQEYWSRILPISLMGCARKGSTATSGCLPPTDNQH